MYVRVYNDGRVSECCHINEDVGLKGYPIMDILLCDMYMYITVHLHVLMLCTTAYIVHMCVYACGIHTIQLMLLNYALYVRTYVGVVYNCMYVGDLMYVHTYIHIRVRICGYTL